MCELSHNYLRSSHFLQAPWPAKGCCVPLGKIGGHLSDPVLFCGTPFPVIFQWEGAGLCI